MIIFFIIIIISQPPPPLAAQSVSPCPSPGRASYLANRVIESRPMSGASCGAVASVVVVVAAV